LPSTDTDQYRNNVDIAARVFAEHGSFIRAVILSKVKDKAQADDMFQGFFLNLVWRPVPKYVRDVRSYLYRAITNDAFDHIRRMERYEALVGRCSQQYGSYYINTTSAEDALITEEEIGEVLGVIERQLNGFESKAIALRYGSCLSISEVAERMNIKSRSVSRYICVGIKKIRRYLTVERSDQE